VIIALAVACTAQCDMPSADSAIASVGDWSLGRDRLADLLVLAQPLPLDSTTATALVEQWIGMAALAQRASAGADLTGSEALDASLWLERGEALLDAHRRALHAEHTAVTPDRARYEFEADTLRLLAHILRGTTSASSEAERDLQYRTARSILDGLIEGGGWADAVQRSHDIETRDESGLLGLVRVDELPPELRGAAGALEPGQVSAIVESPLGFHILFRPRFGDVSDLYARLLAERLLDEADARAADQLRDTLVIRVESARLPLVREMAAGTAPPNDTMRIAWTDGGVLPAGTVWKYVSALPSDARARLAAATDEAATRFVEQLAVRQARIERARTAGASADAQTLADLETMHRTDAETWLAGLSDGAEPNSRAALGRYMERLVARQIPLRPIPPLFRQWLLEPFDWSHDPLVQSQAVARARHLIESASATTGS
jgi:hypothetical protein